MCIKKILLTLVAAVGILCAKAQDPQFSQYYNAPIYLNPGFTGSTPQQRAAISHRIQWPQLPQAFSTYSVSYEFFSQVLKSGFGVMATTDKMGSVGWRTTFAGLSYSYKTQIFGNWVFSPGLYFAYGTNGLDRTKLVMRDGLAYDNVSLDSEIDKVDNAQFFDISAGVVFYNKSVWLGISSYHMNKPNISIIGDESRLPMRINIHGGMNVPLYNGIKKIDNVHYLTPSFVYRSQGVSFQQLDIGLRYHIDPVAFGVWYRGIPLTGESKYETEIINVIQKDAVVFIASLMYRDFQFGYSFDFTVSDLQTTTGGAHEFSIVYEFVAMNLKKATKRKNKILPCPSFIQKRGLSL